MRNVMSPLDGTCLDTVPTSTVDDLNQLLNVAVAATPALGIQPRWQRIAWLTSFRSGLLSATDDLIRLMAHEIGKPVMLGRTELERATALIDQTIAELMTESGDAPYVDDQAAHATRTVITKRFPVGVVGAITPFNFPVNLVLHKVLPAIATGCPVIVKPSERTHAISHRLADVFSKSGMPEGAVQFDFADDGPSHARKLASDPRVAFVTFTGSDTVGRHLAREAGGKPNILELGGSAAVYIADDADIASAAKKCAIGAYAYAGQVCISVQRIYIHRDVFNAFRDALLTEVSTITAGDPRDENRILGPMIDIASATKFVNLCDQLASHQRLVARHIRNDRFVSPVVLTNIDHEHPFIQTEAFAPVVVLEAVNDFSEAIHKMNGTPYGLQSGIFTQRIQDALTAHSQLRGGAVYVNDVPTVRIDKLSYGGDGASGNGREGIRDVMHAYTTSRHLVLS
jgi:glyceraldehyde-3-phosphate dehydrogenase (NADP+)